MSNGTPLRIPVSESVSRSRQLTALEKKCEDLIAQQERVFRLIELNGLLVVFEEFCGRFAITGDTSLIHMRWRR